MEERKGFYCETYRIRDDVILGMNINISTQRMSIYFGFAVFCIQVGWERGNHYE